jgi:hypothetical protein
MKQAPQFQAPAAILRAEIEAWRTAGRMSREAVAIAIVEAHEASGADLATEIVFDFGGDAFDRARKSAQKIFRWLDEGNLPANMIPSVLAALPMERRLNCLSQMYCSMGIEVRQVGRAADGAPDVVSHLPCVMKEASEAQLALVHLSADASDAALLGAHKELAEAAQACDNAARDVMAKVVARQAVARAADSTST